MKIHLIAGKNLSAEDCLLWSQFQQADVALHSPYFRPEFVMNVAAVRTDVEVAVLEEDGQTVGFFPFQRGSWNVARPVAAGLSDFQAVVERPRVSEVTSRGWTGAELIRGCGLAAWHFDHLLASQQTFGSFHRLEAASPYVDLSRGFDAYCAEQQQAGTRAVSKIQQSVRRAEKQLGPMRFEIAHGRAVRVRDALAMEDGQVRRNRIHQRARLSVGSGTARSYSPHAVRVVRAARFRPSTSATGWRPFTWACDRPTCSTTGFPRTIRRSERTRRA